MFPNTKSPSTGSNHDLGTEMAPRHESGEFSPLSENTTRILRIVLDLLIFGAVGFVLWWAIRMAY